MQLGVDLSTFDMFGHSPGWSMLPILKYTCNQNTTWINSINKIQYNLPDQLAEQPIAIPDDVTITTSHQTTNTHGVQMWMSESISAGLLDGMFSATKTVSQAYTVITSTTRLWGTVNSSVSSFKVNFIPYEIAPDLIQLSDNAQNYIDQTIKTQAPIFNQSSVDVYETFFKYFGTHIFTTADTGGVFHLRYETDKYLLTKMSSKKISEQGSISFWNYLTASGAVTGGEKQVDERFASMSTTITTCKGGSFCPNAKSNDYSEWQTSVASAPWIMSAKFIPMWKLIDDKQISDSFVSAILNHQQMAYLNHEIQENIETVKGVIQKGIQSIQCNHKRINGLNCTDYMQKCVSTVCNNHNNLTYCTKQAPGTACNNFDGNAEPGRTMFTEQDTFHSYVPSGGLFSFNEWLYTKQTVILQQISEIQSNVNELLKLPMIHNQTLFDKTATLWKNTLLFAQSEYVWETNTYYPQNRLCYKANKKCQIVDCRYGYSECGVTMKLNLTYLQSFAIYNTTS
eukprot:443098_1